MVVLRDETRFDCEVVRENKLLNHALLYNWTQRIENMSDYFEHSELRTCLTILPTDREFRSILCRCSFRKIISTVGRLSVCLSVCLCICLVIQCLSECFSGCVLCHFFSQKLFSLIFCRLLLVTDGCFFGDEF